MPGTTTGQGADASRLHLQSGRLGFRAEHWSRGHDRHHVAFRVVQALGGRPGCSASAAGLEGQQDAQAQQEENRHAFVAAQQGRWTLLRVQKRWTPRRAKAISEASPDRISNAIRPQAAGRIGPSWPLPRPSGLTSALSKLSLPINPDSGGMPMISSAQATKLKPRNAMVQGITWPTTAFCSSSRLTPGRGATTPWPWAMHRFLHPTAGHWPSANARSIRPAGTAHSTPGSS